MERCGSKTLSKFCRTRPNKRLSDNEARYVFKQVALGVKHIHDNEFCHRDLKMTNILINREGLVKIIDFGFACPSQDKLRMYCGTPSYMAPEMVLKKSYYGQPMDVWALAVVLYKLLTGEYAFGGKIQTNFQSNIF
jgi:MAP/microtubule affinity-regulating kinase